MAFQREAPVRPAAIGDIRVELFDPDPLGTEERRILAHVQVRLDNGEVRIRWIDLAQHLGAATLTQLQTFLTNIRSKAVGEMLPEQTQEG